MDGQDFANIEGETGPDGFTTVETPEGSTTIDLVKPTRLTEVQIQAPKEAKPGDTVEVIVEYPTQKVRALLYVLHVL